MLSLLGCKNKKRWVRKRYVIKTYILACCQKIQRLFWVLIDMFNKCFSLPVNPSVETSDSLKDDALVDHLELWDTCVLK